VVSPPAADTPAEDVPIIDVTMADRQSQDGGSDIVQDAAADVSQGEEPILTMLPASSAPLKDPAPDRTELLRSKPEVVGRFMRLMVPVLVDVYAASVMLSVRTKTLTGLLKAVSFLDEGGLEQVLKVIGFCSLSTDAVLTNVALSSYL
jgi:hypothetical protein